MKRFASLIILPLAIMLVGTSMVGKPWATDISGAWELKTDSGQQLLIIEDDYCALTSYDLMGKKFFYTRGGVLKKQGSGYLLTVEFNSRDGKEVGKKLNVSATPSRTALQSDINGASAHWTKIEESPTPLTGCWRINGRVNNGKMNEMKLGPRKTLKILSGKKFQWMAINTQTGEFFGTGGGNYTFEGGKYTEHIEFFSRDNSRVGASLSFDGRVENNVWYHSGLSSKGDPINETWVKH